MSIFPISGENKDPFGAPIPGIIMYLNDPFQVPVTYINAVVVQRQTPDYAKDLLDRVRYLRQAYSAPFGPNSVAPNIQAFSDAEAFIRKLPLNRTGLPTINVASDGEINFDWSHHVAQIDLGFFGDGTYSYYARGGNYGEASDDEVSVTADVPAQLINIASATAL